MSAAPDARMACGLTPLMRDCLLVIDELSEANGFSPSFREIGRELGLSLSEVARVIASLEVRGHLARRPGHARTLTVLRSIPRPDEPEIELTASGLLKVSSLLPPAP